MSKLLFTVLVWFFIFLFGVAVLGIRFTNPTLTETQLMLAFLPHWAILVVTMAVGLWLITRERK